MSNIKTAAEIREAFLNFFEKAHHRRVSSSTLVPGNDPTLLFTNAGMVQFKEVFLGLENPGYTRATTAQRCVRAGGKHNDLDNVGYTARHHTFFEMLGNFSFGDYFKREAIQFCWTFLTEVLRLPKEKLWVTVFKEDSEAADIWLKELQVDPRRFSYCGEDENFWAMGDNGPCGPCSEVFYDHGPNVPGGPPGSADSHLDRYIEIWNLVFMQYNRDASGHLTPLPKPSVDTGMGLERISAVMQGVHSNYDIDLFQCLLKAVHALMPNEQGAQTSKQVIADHIRSCAFLILDGVLPSNEGRGYVLRRIIRRAIRHGHKLGIPSPFFHRLVPALIEAMGEAYPELRAAKSRIEDALCREENQFSKTLTHGMQLLKEAISGLSGKTLPGEVIFKLYDTYGFPLDLTADIVRERGLSLDEAGFEKAMAAQQALSKRADHFTAKQTLSLSLEKETTFVGYENLDIQATIQLLVRDGEKVKTLDTGEQGILIIDQTPFYAESGGQVGDVGKIITDDACFEVHDTQKQGQVVLHYGVVREGSLSINAAVRATVDRFVRQKTAMNHSATHLLHEALRRVLGDHVIQRGSLVGPDRLRFDFSHPSALTESDCLTVERLVNAEIRKNHVVGVAQVSLDEAKAAGAMALFGEKYGETVRTLKMGDFSYELCGGTHVTRTGDIGYLTLLAESSVASGVRRIEAATGEQAVDVALSHKRQLETLASILKTKPTDLSERLAQLIEKQQQSDKQLQLLSRELQKAAQADVLSQVQSVAGVSLLVHQLPETVSVKSLRDSLDHMKSKLGSGVIVLTLVQGEQVNVIAGVTKDLTSRFHAGELVQALCAQLEGRGGGRVDMAQGGGTKLAALPAALASIPNWLSQR